MNKGGERHRAQGTGKNKILKLVVSSHWIYLASVGWVYKPNKNVLSGSPCLTRPTDLRVL